MAGIVWGEPARRHVRHHLRWIETRSSTRTAAIWAEKISEAVQTLEAFPEIGAMIEDIPVRGLRERLVGNYRIIYRYDGVNCHILAVATAEQDLERLFTPEDLF